MLRRCWQLVTVLAVSVALSKCAARQPLAEDRLLAEDHGIPGCPAGAERDLLSASALQCWFGAPHGRWRTLNHQSHLEALVVDVEARDLRDASDIARRVVEGPAAQAFSEILVYVRAEPGDGVSRFRRVRWTRNGGFETLNFSTPGGDAGLAVHAPLAVQASSAPDGLALVGGTIYTNPSDEPLRDAVLVIRDGKIAAVGRKGSTQIPRNVRTIDCSGLTIAAGFWNSHAHFFERKWTDAAAIPAPELNQQLQEMLTQYGFTSVFDLGSPWENTRRIRDRIESGEVTGPRIRSTGEVLVAAGAVPPDAVIRALGYITVRNAEVSEPSQVAAAVQKVLDARTDGIKVHLQPPPPPNMPFPASGIQVAVNEAHRVGKPVFVHPSSGADVLAAARAGVDVVAHTTPFSGPWDDSIVVSMREHRVALTPTLTVWKDALRHDRVSAQEQVVRTSAGQLRMWVAAGGTVLFGNDLGAVAYDPSEEYTLMGEAGMSFRQILASLTTAPAERFGMSAQLGRIAPGFLADLAVVRGDPSKDTRALAAVQYTLRDGKIIYTAAR
jgi:imidazolonepropionase-like amidohydrolase